MAIYCVAMLLLTFQATSVQRQNVRIENNEFSIQTDAGPRQITHDGTPKRLPVISPDGRRIAYVVDLWVVNVRSAAVSGAPEDVVETDLQGNVLRHIIPEGYVPEQFERLEWIDDQRIGARTIGRANCFYWILNADTGKTLKKWRAD